MADEHKHEDTLLNEDVHEHEHHHHEHDEDECDCGCGHHHHHDEDEEHEHHHHHDDDCGCGCGHHHHHDEDEEHEHHHEHSAGAHSVKRVYTLQNVGCAHCAAKMEQRISELEGVEDCVLVFETKQLRVTGENPDALLPEIRKICSGIESEAKVIAPKPKHYGKDGQRVYTLENLGCAHCAAKMQHQISQLDGIDDCVLVYETKQLRVKGDNPDALLPEIRKICSNIESEVKVIAPEEEKEESSSHPLAEMLIGAALFVAGLLIPAMAVKLVLLIAAYLLLGRHVLLTAVKNIGRGQVFDENFLMAIATVGAFVLGECMEGVAVMLFFQIGELFEHIATNRSRESITELMNIRPDYANIEVNGTITKVSPSEISIGDIIIVKPGEKIPLDGTITSGETYLDTKALTGESVPRKAVTGDTVLSGSLNTGSPIYIKVEKTYGESTVSKILDMVEHAQSKKAKSEKFISVFAKYYTPIVVALALIVMFVPPLFLGDFKTWIYRGLMFLVVSCPCALVVSIPLGFFAGIGCASKNGILVKGSNFIEKLAKLDTVVFDKTGTLTKGVFAVKDVYSVIDKDELIKYAAYAEFYSTHPIAVSVKNAYKNTVDTAKISNYTEISGMGISADIDGHKVLAGNGRLLESNNISHEKAKSHIGSIIYIAVDGKFAGYIVISDEIKADSKAAISALKQLNIKSVMLTGDVKRNADYTAEQIGIDKVYSQLLPQDKVSKLEEILSSKNPKKNVAFVGDGINDAPVLMRSDVGIAMGGIGSDSAIEAADVVLMTDEPSKIAKASKISAKTMSVIIQNIVFAIGVKVLVMILSVLGISTMWLAIFADVGVSLLAILNSLRALYYKD